MKVPGPIPVSLSSLSPIVQQGASPDQPPERRMLLARAALPLPPEDLVAALAFLSTDRSAAVAAVALASLEGLPFGVLQAGLEGATDPGVLDAVARALLRLEGVATRIALCDTTADDTLVFLAAKATGHVLDQLAANQMRYQRCPAIVEALYYNPAMRQGAIATVLENAIRMGLDLSRIPGYEEIVASIFGPEAVKRVQPASDAPVEPAVPGQAAPPPEPVAVPGLDIASALDAAMLDAGLVVDAPPQPVDDTTGQPGAMDEDSFVALLAKAAEEKPAEAEQKDEGGALWTKIGKMTIPQKVRLALLGNDSARAMLIHDSRRVVYMSVLKSPSLADKEIINFAKDRSLTDEVIRTIASNRDWTKLYPVRFGLCANPKCPPTMAMQFIRTLNSKDLKHMASSHDIPGYVARQAKQISHAREVGSKPGS